jgi:hypothetical protein
LALCHLEVLFLLSLTSLTLDVARKGKNRGENNQESTDPSDKDLSMSGEDDDDAFAPAAIDAVSYLVVLHEFTLRPRPKPRQNAQADVGPPIDPVDVIVP